MSITRPFLKKLGLEDSDMIDAIVKENFETIENIKVELDGANAKIKDLEKSTNKDDKVDLSLYVEKSKYEELETQYNDYKNEIVNKETLTNKKNAYINQVLKAENINDKRHDSIVKLFDFNSIELDDKGNIKGLDTLKESAKTEWADFVTKTETKGTEVATPPKNSESFDKESFGKMTYSQRVELKNSNPELFSELNK